jgi:hypothetical protein
MSPGVNISEVSLPEFIKTFNREEYYNTQASKAISGT